MRSLPPVVTIDGPSASGKGTVAARVAAQFGWHYLDSGALYRLLALAAQRRGLIVPATHEGGATDFEIAPQNEALGALAQNLAVRFEGETVWLDGEAVGEALRSEETGRAASMVAAVPLARTGLLARQRAFRQWPGLIADGRDMGSVVFPDAALKIFLTASAEARAERRYKQLISKGLPANIDNLVQDLKERDARDTSRSVAPLELRADAVLLDTTALSIDEAVAFVARLTRERLADLV